MQPDALFYAVATVAVVILGLSKGGFAGVGMISTPLLALVIGPIAAAGVIFPILIVQDLIAVAMYRRTFSWQILATMIPGAALGVCLAYSLASSVPGWALVVFLVGFTTWMVAPAVGSAVAVVACCGAARRWARKQESRRGDLLPWGRKDSGRR